MSHSLRSVDEIPGPKPMPFIGWRGNALRFFRNPVGCMTELYRTHGPVVRLVQGGNKTLFFKSGLRQQASVFGFGPDCTREILTQTDVFETRRPPGPDTDAFKRLATNLFFINSERHKQQRKLFMPSFTRENLKRYYEDMVHFTDLMLKSWQPGEQIDLDAEMSKVTLNIGSKTLYGIDATQSRSSLAHMMSEMLYMLFSPVTMIPINLPGTPYRRLIWLGNRIEEELQKEISRKRNSDEDGVDLLTMMVKLHDTDPTQLTADELVGQAFTLFFAGHDTASKALTWILFLISQHPEVHAELVEELDTELGGGPPEYDQIFRLPVLDRVIKEALRVCTPAVVFTREVTCPTSLGGYEIPQGTEVLYSPYLIHKDPAIYQRANVFDPNRWLTIKPSKYEYLPFGVGSRTCLGSSFAGVQLRLMVAIIVQRRRLEMVPGHRIDLKTNVVISPKGGLPMIVRAQDRDFQASKGEVRGYIRKMVEFS